MSEAVSLDDGSPGRGPIVLSGTQALVRLVMLQARRDRAAGWKTAGFCSGYRGSPLSTLDLEFQRAAKLLEPLGVRYQGGVNEALAATAVWGTQLVALDPARCVEGVFALWFGKGAGLDQCVDVLRHAHGAGTSARGGVLAVVGDDHAQKSSAQPHHCEPTFADLRIPVLYPSTIAEVMRFGLLGYGLSRYSGGWVGLKLLPETVNSTAVVDEDLETLTIHTPEDTRPDPHIRWPDPWTAGESRFHAVKWPRILEFLRVNEINRVVLHAAQPRLGLITAGKSYLDVLEALAQLGLTAHEAAEVGLSIYKLGCPWPIEPRGLQSFAARHPTLLVVEEKRPTIEEQVKSILYDVPLEERPQVYGRAAPDRSPLLASSGELSPEAIAMALGQLLPGTPAGGLASRVRQIREREQALSSLAAPLARSPHFCSGCPHSTSTKLPEGSTALGGIGCHGMAVFDPRSRTATHTHMGGEGAIWIGQAPFTARPHVFQNMGDGTYHHSGSLAIRAAVATGARITYKILFNDAVAMTGGQPVDGPLSVTQLAQSLHHEGVRRIAVLSDEPDRIAAGELPAGATLDHRDALDRLQRELRELDGVSAIIYVQACATEKRRSRKRRRLPEPSARVLINPAVCENCGDCTTRSDCLSVVPIETALGRKRRIDQSSCNQDLSCLQGFCPSFVTVSDAKRRNRGHPLAAALNGRLAALPPPPVVQWDRRRSYDILCAGVGGSGLVTLGALLATAARLCGLFASVHDRVGLAQKFGAVTSHVRLACSSDLIGSVRIPLGRADLVLGCDLVASAQAEVLRAIGQGSTRLIVNTDEAAHAGFLADPDFDFRTPKLVALLQAAAGPAAIEYLEATRLADVLTGDAIGTNLFMLGFALQRGLLPLPLECLERAIELHGLEVEGMKRTLALGRLAAVDLAALRAAADPLQFAHERARAPESLDALIAQRRGELTAYQNAAYGHRYHELVTRVRERERVLFPGREALSIAVARGYFKVLAYKDEYEVARLHTSAEFRRLLELEFCGPFRLNFHFAPPLVSALHATAAGNGKVAFGPWMQHALRILARLRFLRGSPLDPFRYSSDRKLERRLIEEYEAIVREALQALPRARYDIALKLLSLPERIRGFGAVKRRSYEQAMSEAGGLLEQLQRTEEGHGRDPLSPEHGPQGQPERAPIAAE